MEFCPKSGMARGSSLGIVDEALRITGTASSSGSPSLGSSAAEARLGVDLNFDLKLLLSRPFSLDALLLGFAGGSSLVLQLELLVACK